MSISRRTSILILFLAAALAIPLDMQAANAGSVSAAGLLENRQLVPRSHSPLLTAETADVFSGVAQLKLAALDRDALLAEDATEGAAKKTEPQPFRFAVGQEVFMTPDDSGTWTPLAEGMMLWRLRVIASQATSMFFAFDRFSLPPSAELLIYGADEKSWIRPFTASDNNEAGELFTPLLETGDIVLELKVAEAERGQVDLSLAQVFQGYRGPGTRRAAASKPPGASTPLEKSGSCNVDVACPEGAAWDAQIRSVGRYTVVRDGQGFICSGALVNNTAGNRKAYFLTANHCVSNSAQAASMVTYFNYQNSTCRTPGSGASGSFGNGELSQFINGATLRSTFIPSDMTLVELDSLPAAEWAAYYAGWNRSSENPPSATSIHHPRGEEKRISLENDPVTTTSFLGDVSPGDGRFVRVGDWDSGTTEGGSSGSPLFDHNQRIIGHLTGGFAACGNDAPDWYGRVSTGWTGGGSSGNRLSNWLDSAGTGASVLDGVEQNTTPSPAAPTGLTAVAISTTEISIAWTDNADNETEYRIESQPPGSPFLDIGGVSGNTTSSNILTLTPGTPYNFRVRARNAAGDSAYSNIAAATTFGNTGPCVEGPNTLCLLEDRFRVEANFVTNQGASGSANAVELTADTGYFWFFDQENVELMVKLRNACAEPFDRFWVFAGGLTNVQVDITVTDTDTGTIKTYRNPQGTAFQPIQDTQAFATCPGSE